MLWCIAGNPSVASKQYYPQIPHLLKNKFDRN